MRNSVTKAKKYWKHLKLNLLKKIWIDESICLTNKAYSFKRTDEKTNKKCNSKPRVKFFKFEEF